MNADYSEDALVEQPAIALLAIFSIGTFPAISSSAFSMSSGRRTGMSFRC